MKIIFVSTGWRDYLYWQHTDRAVLKKINRLIDDITRDDPFTGIGKPEPLRYGLAGAWSRRITDEHRLVHVIGVDDDGKDTVTIIGCRHHYENAGAEGCDNPHGALADPDPRAEETADHEGAARNVPPGKRLG